MKPRHFSILCGSILVIGASAIYFAPQLKAWTEQRARDAKIAEWARKSEQQDASLQRFRALLPSLQVDRVYYIGLNENGTDWKKPDRFHRYRVISSSNSLPPDSSGDLKSSFGRMLDTQPDSQAGCFIPHHAVSLSRGDETFDVLVCFNCNNYEVRSPTGDFGGPFSADERATWDKIFATAGLSMPVEARDPDLDSGSDTGV